MTWANSWTNTSSSTFVYPLITSGGSSVTFGEIATYQPPQPAPPREPTPLEWLDKEIEDTCALARAA